MVDQISMNVFPDLYNTGAHSGVHNVGVWRQTGGWNSWAQSSCLGSQKHGLRAAASGVEPEIPDKVYQVFSQQAGICSQLY